MFGSPSPSIAAGVLAVCLTLPPSSYAQAQAQLQPPKTDTARGLSIEYADGRINTGPLRRTGGMWTSDFPRITGADTSRNGVRLTTLDVKHAIDGAEVVVIVSLCYGGPGQNAVTVATLRLAQDKRVVVNELRAYGVEPIAVSVVPITRTIAYAPEATSVSPQVSVRAEAVGDNVSAYRVFVTNGSTVPLMWLQFRAYRGDRVAVLGSPRGKRNLPLILPGAEYNFDVTSNTRGLQSADGSETWQPIDRIQVSAIMWLDGMLEGDPERSVDQRGIDARRTAQLRVLLAALRTAPRAPIARLRAEIAAGMSSDLETRRARDAMLADLDRFMTAQISSDAPEFRAWLGRTISEYEEWLARLDAKP
jgi:hypothetical protein